MKDITKLKWLLVGLGVVVASTTLFFVVLLINQNSTEFESGSIDAGESLTLMTDEEIDSALEAKGYDEETIAELTDIQKDKIILGEDYYYEDNLIRLYSSNEYATEYTGDVDAVFDLCLEYLMNGDFYSAVEEVKTILNDYNLTTGDNLNLASLYSDAVKMTYYDTLDLDGKESILQAHRNVKALIADTLYAYVCRRESVILDGASKTPVFDGDYEIENMYILDEDSEDAIYYAAMWVDEPVRNVYRVELNLPNAPDMYAIVLQSEDCTLRIAGFYGDSTNQYITVSERASLGVDLE